MTLMCINIKIEKTVNKYLLLIEKYYSYILCTYYIVLLLKITKIIKFIQ